MKIILWIGNEPNQIALANKVCNELSVIGMVLETKQISKRKAINLKQLIDRVVSKVLFDKSSKTWKKLMLEYKEQFPALPNLPHIVVNSINDPETLTFTESLSPDIVMVSGTFLIRKPIIEIKLPVGILNLHTGLSPYIKGGPNCTNWCIASNQVHLIGNSIMWLDEGIDSGNLIATETTTFTGQESFYEVHRKVMNHAHQLYIDAVKAIINGKRNSVKQSSITSGRIYYSKDWNSIQKYQLQRNFKKFSAVVNSKKYKALQSKLTLVDLN